jgi:hypothetical protein
MRLKFDITATRDPRSRTIVSPATRTNFPSTVVVQQTATGGSESACRVIPSGVAERMRTSLPGRIDPSGGITRCRAHASDQMASAIAITARRVRVERDMLASLTGDRPMRCTRMEPEGLRTNTSLDVENSASRPLGGRSQILFTSAGTRNARSFGFG